MPEKPDIIWIYCDELRTNCLINWTNTQQILWK